LSNDGEKLELSMPGAPESSFVPYILTEKVNFSDGSHPAGYDLWPTEADGSIGYSLQRNAAGKYGNDVANWQASVSTPISPDFKWIEIHQAESGLVLLWTVDGVLQSTTNLTGSWTSLPGAISPFEITPDSHPAEFFRLQ
jgi:hypothetical protein